MDENRFSVLGGDADPISERMSIAFVANAALTTALQGCAASLGGPDKKLTAQDLEVAVIERAARRRSFRRIESAEVTLMLG